MRTRASYLIYLFNSQPQTKFMVLIKKKSDIRSPIVEISSVLSIFFFQEIDSINTFDKHAKILMKIALTMRYIDAAICFIGLITLGILM